MSRKFGKQLQQIFNFQSSSNRTKWGHLKETGNLLQGALQQQKCLGLLKGRNQNPPVQSYQVLQDSSSGQFQAEGDLAIPGPWRFLQRQPGPSSSGQIQTSLDSATPGFSGFIPSQPRTSSATLSLSLSGQSHSQENQARAIASTSTGRNLQDTTALPQAASGSYHERVEGPGPSQITAHGSVAEQLWYVSLPSNPSTF